MPVTHIDLQSASPGAATGVSWLDPRLVQTLGPAVRTTVTLLPGVTTKILSEDIGRVGFVVLKSAAMASFPAIGPGGLGNVFALREDANIDMRGFVLTEWLSLIVGDWYATSTAGGQIEIFEFRPRF